jgi:hypothetical protein
VKYFTENKHIRKNMDPEKMSDNLVAKLAGMISLDTSIDPRYVPDVLIPFKELGIINEQQLLVALRDIVIEKIVDYAHPFAHFMVQNYDKWENHDEESIALKEQDFMLATYPQILKIIRKD